MLLGSLADDEYRSEYGVRRDKFRLCLADLADGSAQVLDCPDNFSIDSLRGGVVTYAMYVGDEPACFS